MFMLRFYFAVPQIRPVSILLILGKRLISFCLDVLSPSLYKSLPAFPILTQDMIMVRGAFCYFFICYLAPPMPNSDHYKKAALLNVKHSTSTSFPSIYTISKEESYWLLN